MKARQNFRKKIDLGLSLYPIVAFDFKSDLNTLKKRRT